MDNISFKANIGINASRIQACSLSDKFFADPANRSKLDEVVQKVASLALMEEKSSVRITPRLDNNILNLICKVKDDSSIVETTIKERSARRITQDSSFFERFIQNIIKAIKNVDKTKNCVLEIQEFVKNSKTLKDNKFLCNLPENVLNSFNKDVDPTKRILSILRRIEIEYPNETNYISIKNISHFGGAYKQSRVNTYFCINNGVINKRIPISQIMKDPIDNLFIQV